MLGELSAIEPLILADGWLWALVGEGREAELVTAWGNRHRLARLGPVAMLQTHLLSQVREQTSRSSLVLQDPVAYFLHHLVPLAQRGCSTQGCLRPTVSVVVPLLPEPSLWVLGRIWLLEEGQPSPGELHIVLGGRTFHLSGHWLWVGEFQAQWMAQLGILALEPDAQLEEAWEGFRRNGYLEAGDILLIAGEPPLLGHIVPAHYNRALGRRCERDLAVVTALVPLHRSGQLRVYQKTAEGWRPLALPHMLCLGERRESEQRPDDSGLRLLFELRWAAVQIARHGQFCEMD